MKIHPAAKVLPDMTPEEFSALKADIASNGLLCPIERYQGAVLDGRHRLKACKELGIELDIVDVDLCGQSPAAYVWSLNGARRHLTASQRAAVAVDMLPQLRTEAKKRMVEAGKSAGKGRPKQGVGLNPPPNNDSGKARDKAAEIVNVEPTYVSKAEKLKNESDLINKSPYDNGWLIQAVIDAQLKKDLSKTLMSEKKYQEFLETNKEAGDH